MGRFNTDDGCVRKLVSHDELIQAVRAARATGHTIVHCHGCFDIVHPGHLRYLEFARRQGDLLIVSVTGDRQIDKGSQRPFIPEELRAENLAALEFVDWVYINPHPTAAEILAEIQPDIYVKGREYENSNDVGFQGEQAIVESYGGRVVFSSGEVVFSSTQLLEILGADDELTAQRLAAICRRHSIHGSALNDILGEFQNKRVVVIGDIVFDRYILCDNTDVTSEGPMMSLVELERREYVGGAAIVARHIAALGASAVLLTAGAEDVFTDKARQVLADENVEAIFLPTRRSLPLKNRFVVEETKVLRVECGEFAPLDSQAERRALAELSRQLDNADAIILCDFGYGMITGGFLSRALPMMRHKHKIITADVSGPRANLLAYSGVDLLCPTERELRAALHDFEHGLSQVAWDALNRTNAKHLFVTLGKRGVVVFDRQTQDTKHADYRGRLVSEHLHSFADRTVDRLGCGDAFLATATLSMVAGGNLMQAAYLGSAAAAVELASLGNVPVAMRDLRRWLEKRLEPVQRLGSLAGPKVCRATRLRTAPTERSTPNRIAAFASSSAEERTP